MVSPFLRVDLSDQSGDFASMVRAEGFPFLDPTGTNFKILSTHLKGLIAEPEIKGKQVAYYVRSYTGARLANVHCTPASEDDLEKLVHDDFVRLITAVETATTKSRDEEDVLRVAREELASLSTQLRKPQRGFSFFKYQDAAKKWHLVWCVGYQRKHPQDPSPPQICKNENCRHLSARHMHDSKCPMCHLSELEIRGQRTVEKNRRRSPTQWIAILTVCLIAVAGGLFWQQFFRGADTQDKPGQAVQPSLAATPATWSGPVGSRISFLVKRIEAAGVTDVSRETVPQVSDPRILSFDDFGLQALARSPGKAVVDFRVGSMSQQVTITVLPPQNPDRVFLEPEGVILGVGTTARLKLFGEYKNQGKVDLTESAEWLPGGERIVFAYRGLVEGLAEGETPVRARYRASLESNPLEATARISVRAKKYDALTLRLDRLSVAAGQVAEISAEVKPDEGSPLSISESSLLHLSIDPADAGAVMGRRLHAKKPGTLKLTGRFQSLEDTIILEVTPESPADSKLDVQPRTLELAVGEIASLSLKSSRSDPPIRVVSVQPGIVRIQEDRRLVGRAEGNTRVEVIQGEEIIALDVTVTRLQPTTIFFAPSAVSVRVDDMADLRVVAELDSQKTFDVAPDALDWIGIPRPDYVRLDKAQLRVRGLKPTGEDAEVLAVRFGEREARASLQVLSAPFRLELTPAGPLEIPAGQKIALQIWATYGDGNRQEIAADRVEWNWVPTPGLGLEAGALHSEQAHVGPVKIAATYQGAVSNDVDVKTVPAVALKLALAAKPDQLTTGQAGMVEITASTGADSVSVVDSGWSFQSSNPDVLIVAPGTGAFRGALAGKATITATAPSGESANTEVTVLAAVPEKRSPKTKSVRILTEQPLPVRVPLGAEFTDYRIEAIDEEGGLQDVTKTARGDLAFEGEPEDIPVVLRDGRLIAVHAGAVLFTASHEGVESDKPLPFVVVDELQVDEIRVTPDTTRIAVGESAALAAEGFWMGRSVGMLSDHPRISWKQRAGEGVVTVNGPQVTAVKAGESGVTAQFDAVVSDVASITVVEEADSILDRVEVSPAELRLQAGDSRKIGDDIQVTRSGVDFSMQADLSSANPAVVLYDSEQRTLTAVGPGRTVVAYAAGGQLVQQAVEVVEAEAPAASTRVEIEPNGGVLAVGEQLNVRGFQICEDCQTPRAGRTSSLVLTSSDPTVCEVNGTALVGMQPGRVQIEARLPGVEAVNTTTFVVVDTAFDRLAIVPPRIDLPLGGQSQFQVFAITSAGRRLLGNHPDLSLTLEGPEPVSVNLNSAARSVSAVAPGRAQLVARWRAATAQIPVIVKGEPVRAIRLVPEDASVTAGATQFYQVFAQRGAKWMPLSMTDGLTLRSANPNVARIAQGPQVEALKAGVARIVVNYNNRRAEARLTVSSTSGAAGPPAAPEGLPVGLRFIPNLFRIEMGTPGDSIRVVRIYSDGRQEDVDHIARISVRDPQDVISVEQTASGPVVRPKRIGQTQLDASLGELRTQSPLLIDVVAAVPRTARVRVLPNPMRLQPGETGAISVVEVQPARGGRPFTPDYKLSASPSPVITADDASKSIRGLKPGNAVATVTVLDPNGGFDGLTADIPVEVIDPTSPAPAPTPGAGGGAKTDTVDAPRLVLDGATEMIVGAEVQLQAERQQGGTGVVVSAEAQLSLPTAEQGLASVGPGCTLIARKPGTVHVQARSDGLVSNIHEIKISPPALTFERLVLSMESKPLAVGEIRAYELWGYPPGGRPREELTSQMPLDDAEASHPRMELTVLEPSDGTEVLAHRPPQVVAQAPGKSRLQASLGKLKSNVVDVSVVADPGNQPIQIRIEPSRTVLREGEKTPAFRVLVRSRGASTFREVDNAGLESIDTTALSPIPDDPRRFTAAKSGKSGVRATFGELSDVAEVKVVPDRFREVIDRNLDIRKQSFELQLEVISSASAEKIEYRVTVPESREASPWTAAERKASDLSVMLKTPLIALGANSHTYRLILEARDAGSTAVERYPFSFQIKNSATIERKN